MQENPDLSETNNEGQFSDEAKETTTTKKVNRNWWTILKLLGAYLVGAWTILQFLDWIFTRNQISPYWVDLFMWLFIGLLPAILFYLFYKERIDHFGSTWKDKFVFSSNILVLLLVLFFSFRNTDLGATTKEITFVDTNGNSQRTTITKQEFRKKITVFDFEAQEVDSNSLWLEKGIRGLVGLDAAQDKAFVIIPTAGEFPMANKLKMAEGNDLFVDGKYQLDGKLYKITPRIYNARNGHLQQERTFTGADLFALIDSISLYIREQSGVAPSLVAASKDLPIESFTSSSLAALKSFFQGGYANLERAIQLDSTFSFASYFLGVNLYNSDRSELDTKFYLDLAFRHREKLPFDIQNTLLSYRYMAYDDLEAAKRMLQLQLEVDPDSDFLNAAMFDVYENSRQLDQLLAFTTQWSKRDKFVSADAYGRALQLNLESRRLLKEIRPFTILYPNNEFLEMTTFKAHLIDKNWEAATKVLEKIKLTRPQYEPQIKLIEQSIAYQKSNTISKDHYQAFEGIHRFYDSERIGTLFPHPDREDLMLAHVPNSLVLLFPFSNNQLMELRPFSLNTITLHKIKRDSNDQVYAMEAQTHRLNSTNQGLFFTWRIDSLVLKAEALLFQGKYEQAESAYIAAIAKHPKLYFLQDALQHVRYMKGKTEAEIQEQLASVVGQYGDRKFWLKEGRLFYKRAPFENTYFPQMELFPISENRYINFTRQHIQFAFDYENNPAIASYSYLYDRNSAIWVRNNLDTDYQLRNPFLQ